MLDLYGAIHVLGVYAPSDDYAHSSGRLDNWEAVTWKGKETHWSKGLTAHEFWDWLNNLPCDVTIYGWKIWQAWCLLDGVAEIASGRIKCNTSGLKPKHIFIAGDPPTIIIIGTAKGNSVKLIDLANYGIGPGNFRWLCGFAMKAAKDYHQLCKDVMMGEPQATAASQAWHSYQLFHKPENPADPESSCGATDLEEAAYFGGRAECGRLGKFDEKLYHVDTNAMYTTIGLNSDFPRALVGCWQRNSYSFAPPKNNYLRIADVTIRTDKPWYPATDMVRVTELRQPDRRDNAERVIYPIGTFRTALCEPELQLAEQYGHVKEYHRVQYYEPAPLMESWSKWALAAREAVKTGHLAHMATCIKKIINSLPGKWGQRVKQFKDFSPLDLYEPEEHRETNWCLEWGRHPKTGELTQYRTIGGHCQYLDREELAKGACPAVAAFWTSYGRIDLLTKIIIPTGDNWYYCHTDGAVVNEQGLRALTLAPTCPGGLRLTASGNDGKIIGVQGYYLEGSWHVAGGINEAEDEGFGRQMWKHKAGYPIQHVADQIDKIRTYNHGTVTKDGRVLPFVVGKLPKT